MSIRAYIEDNNLQMGPPPEPSVSFMIQVCLSNVKVTFYLVHNFHIIRWNCLQFTHIKLCVAFVGKGSMSNVKVRMPTSILVSSLC